MVVAAACHGPSTPPPCQFATPPPPWQAPPECCGDYKDWPDPVKSIQLDAEWLLFDAEVVFNYLPQDTRDQNMDTFKAARDGFIAQDQSFIKSVEAARQAGNKDWSGAKKSLSDATNLFVTAVKDWMHLSQGEGQQKAKDADSRANQINAKAAK